MEEIGQIYGLKEGDIHCENEKKSVKLRERYHRSQCLVFIP